MGPHDAAPRPPPAFLSEADAPGAFGALLAEYARAAEDFVRVVESFEPAAFVTERPSDDPDTRSPQAVCAHACGAARRYADYIRKARGLPHDERYEQDPSAVRAPTAVRGVLASALRYTEAAVEGLPGVDAATLTALRFPVRWGPIYDPEMILEHAIVHLLRHRRQLERWNRR